LFCFSFLLTKDKHKDQQTQDYFLHRYSHAFAKLVTTEGIEFPSVGAELSASAGLHF